MSSIAIITDSDASLPADVAARYSIQQVPIIIQFGLESLRPRSISTMSACSPVSIVRVSCRRLRRRARGNFWRLTRRPSRPAPMRSSASA